MALNIADLRASFDTSGWRLGGGRCIPILHHADGEPVDDFKPSCTGHVLYRLYGYDGRLLYLGMTKDLYERCKRGHRSKPWWECVAFATVENSFTDRHKLSAAEFAAIRNEHPFHNVADSPTLHYHRNGSPGPALWASSPAIFKICDALWQARHFEHRRDIVPDERHPHEGRRLADGEGWSGASLYRRRLVTSQ